MSAQQALDADGGVDLGIPVRAFNRSDTEVVWMYDRRRYVIPPGGNALVPYMAMVVWQGDPRAIDLPSGRRHEQHRRHAREALAVLYGVYEHDERWADIPLVECYPIDSDVRFETVLHDPDGISLSDVSESNSQLAFMRQEMERMAQQVAILQSNVAAAEQEEAALAQAGIDPDDLDRQETTSRAASPEEAGVSMVPPAPTKKPPRAKADTTARAKRAGEDVPVKRDGE